LTHQRRSVGCASWQLAALTDFLRGQSGAALRWFTFVGLETRDESMSYSGFTLVKEGTWAENIVLFQKFDHQLTAAQTKRNNKAECIWIKVLTSNSEASLNPQGIMVSARAGMNEIVEGTHDSVENNLWEQKRAPAEGRYSPTDVEEEHVANVSSITSDFKLNFNFF
jgi:hypothetical protein